MAAKTRRNHPFAECLSQSLCHPILGFIMGRVYSVVVQQRNNDSRHCGCVFVRYGNLKSLGCYVVFAYFHRAIICPVCVYDGLI